jgi:hypothetical protein
MNTRIFFFLWFFKKDQRMLTCGKKNKNLPKSHIWKIREKSKSTYRILGAKVPWPGFSLRQPVGKHRGTGSRDGFDFWWPECINLGLCKKSPRQVFFQVLLLFLLDNSLLSLANKYGTVRPKRTFSAAVYLVLKVGDYVWLGEGVGGGVTGVLVHRHEHRLLQAQPRQVCHTPSKYKLLRGISEKHTKLLYETSANSGGKDFINHFWQGSGSVCFRASWIRIHNLFVRDRIWLRIRIIPSTSKKKWRKNLDFYCSVGNFFDFFYLWSMM